MNNKIYYIGKDEFTGCIKSKLSIKEFFTNEKEAIKKLNKLKKENENKKVLYHLDFEWKNDLLNNHKRLLNGKVDINILNDNLNLFDKIA